MDNYQAIAYAWVALYQMKKEGKAVTPESLSDMMSYLMDMKSETEIERLKETLENK